MCSSHRCHHQCLAPTIVSRRSCHQFMYICTPTPVTLPSCCAPLPLSMIAFRLMNVCSWFRISVILGSVSNVDEGISFSCRLFSFEFTLLQAFSFGWFGLICILVHPPLFIMTNSLDNWVCLYLLLRLLEQLKPYHVNVMCRVFIVCCISTVVPQVRLCS